MPSRRQFATALVGAILAGTMVVLPLHASLDGWMLKFSKQLASAKDGKGGARDGGGTKGGNAKGGGEGSERGDGNGGKKGGANGDRGGNGGSKGGGKGNAGGNAVGSGGGNGGGKGSGAGKSVGASKSNGGKNKSGTQTSARGAAGGASRQHYNPKTGDTIQINGNTIDVLHGNGMREKVSGGRYEMKDSKGRIIINRPATGADLARLRGMLS